DTGKVAPQYMRKMCDRFVLAPRSRLAIRGVDTGGLNIDQHLASGYFRLRKFTVLHHIGFANSFEIYRLHTVSNNCSPLYRPTLPRRRTRQCCVLCSQYLIDLPGIGLAPGGLHDLADEETDHLGLARQILLDLIGV